MAAGGPAIAVFRIRAGGGFSELLHPNRADGVVICVASRHRAVVIGHEPRHLAAMRDDDMANIASGASMVAAVDSGTVIVVAVGAPTGVKGRILHVWPIGGICAPQHKLRG